MGGQMNRDAVTLLGAALVLIAIVLAGCLALQWAYSGRDPVTDLSAMQQRH
jgi:hypothetical protein